MPLLRYFFFVGGALLATLFMVEAFLAKLPVTERITAATDLSMIRIHSDRKWPQRVVFDTTMPSVALPSTAIAESPTRTNLADAAAKASVREAFAQLPNQVQSADPRKAEPRRKRKSVARAYTGRPLLVAQQPRLGLFGNGIW